MRDCLIHGAGHLDERSGADDPDHEIDPAEADYLEAGEIRQVVPLEGRSHVRSLRRGGFRGYQAIPYERREIRAERVADGIWRPVVPPLRSPPWCRNSAIWKQTAANSTISPTRCPNGS